MAISKSQSLNDIDPWQSLGVVKKKIFNSRKLFYGKYPFKVDFAIPSIFLHRNAKLYKDFSNFKSYVTRRKVETRSQWAGLSRKYEFANAQQIYTIYKVCKEYGSEIRLRVEGDHLSICAELEKDLLDIVINAKIRRNITEVHRPENDEARSVIDNGGMFVNSDKYKYRVMIRGARYNPETKQQILNYFNNYKDAMFISPGVIYHLSKPDESYVSGYFHVDKTDSLLFLKMIAPNFIGKIFTLTVSDDK